MSEHPVEPLERAVQVQFDPTRRRRDRLAAVLGAPAFHEAHSDRAHPRELVNSLKALVDRLREQGGEFLIVEYLQIATWGDFADSSRMPAIALVAIWGLNENGRIAQAFGKDFAADVIEPDSLADVTSRLFNDWIAVNVRQ